MGRSFATQNGFAGLNIEAVVLVRRSVFVPMHKPICRIKVDRRTSREFGRL